jgi:GntR family transcriptional regulator of vanillate catabolism
MDQGRKNRTHRNVIQGQEIHASPRDRTIPAASESESQTLRALLLMRELLIRGEFEPGGRILEIPLAARLGVSRIPLRLVLDRLEHEGLLEARPRGGFLVRQFTIQDILDVIELRGVLEGTAARLAAERLESKDELGEMLECIEETDRHLRNSGPGVDLIGRYIPLNERFHARLLDLAKSSMLRRSIDQVLTLPFASPNAFVAAEAESVDRRETLLISNFQHRSIADAIANREGTRAEAVAREHARNVRRSVSLALRERRFHQLPGGSLVRIPEAV